MATTTTASQARARLTPRRQRFVEEYLVNPCATQAARAAGYSAKTASQIGYELLLSKPVADAIKEARRERAERLRLRADDVVKGMLALVLECRYETTRVQALDILAKHLGPEAFGELGHRLRNGLAEGLTLGELLAGHDS